MFNVVQLWEWLVSLKMSMDFCLKLQLFSYFSKKNLFPSNVTSIITLYNY